MGAFHIMASLRRTELLNGLQLYLTFLFYILIISGPVLPHEPKYTLVMDFLVHYFFGFITLSPEQHMVNSSCKIPHCKSKFGQSGCEIWNILLTENTLISDVKANQTCFLVYCTSTQVTRVLIYSGVCVVWYCDFMMRTIKSCMFYVFHVKVQLETLYWHSVKLHHPLLNQIIKRKTKPYAGFCFS